MHEIAELRTENSKTFRKDDGSYKTIQYSNRVHFNRNGSMQKTSVEHDKTDEKISFGSLPYDLNIDRDSWCGTIEVSKDGYSIVANIVPVYNNMSEVVDEKLDVVSTGEECVIKQKLTQGCDWKYKVRDGKIKAESLMRSKEDIPEKFAFVIKYNGVKASRSNRSDIIVTNPQRPDDEEPTKKEYPRSVNFTKDGSEIWKFEHPIYINQDGEERIRPLDIQKIEDGVITGTFDLPHTTWIDDSLEMGEIKLDPTFTEQYKTVFSGDSTTRTIPSSGEKNIEIISASVTWSGISETTTEEYRLGTNNSFSFNDDSLTTGTFSRNETRSVPEPDTPSGYTFLYFIDNSGDIGVQTSRFDDEADYSVTVTVDTPWSGEVVKSRTSDGSLVKEDVIYSYNITDTTYYNQDITVDMSGEVFEKNGDVDLLGGNVTAYMTEQETTEETTNANVTIDGTTISCPSFSLGQGQTSSTTVTSNITEGDLTFYHSISGVGKADFKLEYDWDYLPPDAPVNLSGGAPNA